MVIIWTKASTCNNDGKVGTKKSLSKNINIGGDYIFHTSSNIKCFLSLRKEWLCGWFAQFFSAVDPVRTIRSQQEFWDKDTKEYINLDAIMQMNVHRESFTNKSAVQMRT